MPGVLVAEFLEFYPELLAPGPANLGFGDLDVEVHLGKREAQPQRCPGPDSRRAADQASLCREVRHHAQALNGFGCGKIAVELDLKALMLPLLHPVPLSQAPQCGIRRRS